jgi:outer membrane autotransporter protein
VAGSVDITGGTLDLLLSPTVLVSPDYAGPAFWTHGFDSWGSTDSDDNSASLDRSTGGLLIGADTLSEIGESASWPATATPASR